MIKDTDLVTVGMLRGFKAEVIKEQQELLFLIISLAIEAEEEINNHYHLSDNTQLNNIARYIGISDDILNRGMM